MPVRSILVIGAGELGTAILRALADRAEGGCRVTVLLRARDDRAASDRDIEMRALGIDVLHADLTRLSAAHLAPFDAVIACAGFVAGRGTQLKLTATVLDAGVPLYIPWQFGVDYDVIGRGSGQDVWDEQLDVRDMLRGQSRTQWLIVSTGMFMSFLFEPAFGVVDLQGAQVHALGSWDHRVTVTTPEDIGRLTAAILFADPPIRDAVVHVGGDTVSYRELADIVEDTLGRPVRRTLWSSSHLAADATADPADDLRKYRLAFARSTGVAWDMDTTFNVEHGIDVTDVRTWLARRSLASRVPPDPL